MAMANGGAGTAESLRPVRRPRLPRGGTLLRAGLVAALLGLAAAVLHTPSDCPPAPRVASGPSGAAPTAPAGGDTPQSTADPQPATAPEDPHPTGVPFPLPTGLVGVPVRLAEPAALAVVRPGARVDLLAVPAGGRPGEASLLAAGALVLDVVGVGATDGSAALYLALRPDQAQRAVGQPEGSRFAVVVRG
ncbi:flagellar biosynthesis protein FlgA [Micromonospora sp. NPDC094482]|uniref:flagellar biosynthesis protein FlgA n=1 Tax=unclassified Micromonospora TaxID=2617518 RepID=UPI0033278A5F